MIVVDGRTDMEKLYELLKEPEQEELEFKERLNLDDDHDSLSLVKDLVALANCSNGGYLLVGVDNNRNPVLPIGSITDRARFDGARINDLLNKYIDSSCLIISQIHETNSHEVVMLFIKKQTNDYPIPFSKVGQYQDNKCIQQTIFRKGDLFVREGAQNQPLQYKHWGKLLKNHDEQIKNETRKDIDALIGKLSENGILRPTLALSNEMDDVVYVRALQSIIDSQNYSVLNRAISQSMQTAQAITDDYENVVKKLAIIAIEAIYCGKDTVANNVIDSLYQLYSTLLNSEKTEIEQLLSLIMYVYIIGSIAVRKHNWSTVKLLVIKEGTRNYTNRYSSWIREVQVEATRQNLFTQDDSGLIISLARRKMVQIRELRPDILDESVDENPSKSDPILNALCQFDLLYNIWTYAVGKQHGGAYPSFSRFSPSRVSQIFKLIIDKNSNNPVFSDIKPSILANSMNKVFTNVEREPSSFFSGWFGIPNELKEYIETNNTSEA